MELSIPTAVGTDQDWDVFEKSHIFFECGLVELWRGRARAQWARGLSPDFVCE
jgi:hypothetical protein